MIAGDAKQHCSVGAPRAATRTDETRTGNGSVAYSTRPGKKPGRVKERDRADKKAMAAQDTEGGGGRGARADSFCLREMGKRF